jgi:hypothetical protein
MVIYYITLDYITLLDVLPSELLLLELMLITDIIPLKVMHNL